MIFCRKIGCWFFIDKDFLMKSDISWLLVGSNILDVSPDKLKNKKALGQEVRQKRQFWNITNITFFMENKVWIFFHLTIFVKKATFSEKMAKKIWGNTTFFSRWGYLMPKVNITLFYPKLDARFFHIKQFFFGKSKIFVETLKNSFESAFDNF